MFIHCNDLFKLFLLDIQHALDPLHHLSEGLGLHTAQHSTGWWLAHATQQLDKWSPVGVASTRINAGSLIVRSTISRRHAQNSNPPDESSARTEFQTSRRPPYGNVQLESASRSLYPGRPGPEGFPNQHKHDYTPGHIITTSANTKKWTLGKHLQFYFIKGLNLHSKEEEREEREGCLQIWSHLYSERPTGCRR